MAFGIAMVVFFILISVTRPKSNTASQQVNAQPQQQAATISQNAAIPYTTNTSSPAAAKAIAPAASPKTTKAAPNIPASPQPKQPAAATPAPVANPQPTPTPTPTPTPQTDNQNTSPVSNETVSQENAVAKAQSYLNYSAFSHDGRVAQLEYDQFSQADAVYGADNSGANWDAQAAERPKNT